MWVIALFCIYPQFFWFVSALGNLALSYCYSGQLQKAIETYEQVVGMMTGDRETPILSLSTCMYNTLLSAQEFTHLCT